MREETKCILISFLAYFDSTRFSVSHREFQNIFYSKTKSLFVCFSLDAFTRPLHATLWVFNEFMCEDTNKQATKCFFTCIPAGFWYICSFCDRNAFHVRYSFSCICVGLWICFNFSAIKGETDLREIYSRTHDFPYLCSFTIVTVLFDLAPFIVSLSNMCGGVLCTHKRVLR